MKKPWKWIIALTATLLASGCATTGDGAGEGDEKTAAKGDCPDCDEAGPGALIQAGLADEFYSNGDKWQVAFQFKRRAYMSKATVLNVPEEDLELGTGIQAARSVSEVFLFDYEVTHTYREIFSTPGDGKVQREVARVEITPGSSEVTSAHPELFSGQQIGRFTHKFSFDLNDLLEPVQETTYSRRYPNGRTIRSDAKSHLQTGSNLYPHTVPRVLAQNTLWEAGANISMSPEIEAVADAYVAGWRDVTFHKYTFDGLGEIDGQGDVVYWAPGALWPFYVRTAQGEGVMISFQNN